MSTCLVQQRVCWVRENGFIDISTETYSFTTDVGNSVTRSELAATYGFRLRETMYALVGYQYGMYGTGFYSTGIGTSVGPFIGFSINNLRMGQGSENVFSIAIAVQFSSVSFVTPSQDQNFNMKLGYRKANSPHSYALKYQTIGSDFHAEYIAMLNYSYQFGAI